MGVYETCDFVLLMLGFAISSLPSWRRFFSLVGSLPLDPAALWHRHRLPSRSALSRFLGDIQAEAVQALRELLLSDLLARGLRGRMLGGLFDRQGHQRIVFDIDATRTTARQRALVATPDYPPVRRRRERSYAKGYAGRKRGHTVRNRTTLQQAHTNEWLGSWGSAGNGDIWGELECCLTTICAYLHGHHLTTGHSLARLDGAYGWARGAWMMQEHGIGYIMRCSDYGLLNRPEVKLALRHGLATGHYQTSTGSRREIFDLGLVSWCVGNNSSQTTQTRLILVSRPYDPKTKQIRVGKRRGNRILEIFVSDQAPENFSAQDLLTTYYGRGEFEDNLGQENVEQKTAQYCTDNPHGQDFWQLLSQWIWNWRLRMSTSISEMSEVRQTLIDEEITLRSSQPEPLLKCQDAPFCGERAEMIEPQHTDVCLSTSFPRAEETVPKNNDVWTPSKATGRAARRLSAERFTRLSDEEVRCPEGKILRRQRHHIEGEKIRMTFQARIEDCRECRLGPQCRGSDIKGRQGRCVSYLAPRTILAQGPVQHQLGIHCTAEVQDHRLGDQPLIWKDVPACQLRRSFVELIEGQHIAIHSVVSAESVGAQRGRVWQSRDERSHRRMTWKRRLARNARPEGAGYQALMLFGIPSVLANVLSLQQFGDDKP